ncbi:MAG: hypothetical protein IJQ98_00315, partial [Oscillospiraceae bacterium]|nr:hypothetical protein [Oscillospiraceae bacterium]
MPQSSLTGLLTNEDAEGAVQLVSVNMGEAYYARSSDVSTYYVGEEKMGISTGYPLYSRDGQVLCFIDNKMKLVTADWETLDTYDGLYESDGVTFNADNSQADIEEVILVRVDGGYAVAEETEVEVIKNAPVVIPMNSACSFRETEIVYYSLVESAMLGSRLEVPSGAVITIGGNSYTYLDFLKNLGIWEEKNEQLTEPEIEPTPEQEDIPEQEKEQEEKNEPVSGGEGTTALGTVDDLTEMTETVPGEEEEPEPAGNKQNEDQVPEEGAGKAEHSGRTSTKEASTVFEKAGAAVSNPNEKPAEAAPAEKPAERNVDYVKPTVTFSGGLTPWVYTIRTTVTVEDPAGRLDGGVRILVYNVADDGTETQALRRVITASGTVDLGQLTPEKTFHIKAEYTYYDKLNYKQSESLDLGTATTLPFSEIGQIKLRLRDETENAQQATDESKVQIFSKCLQMKDIVFSNVGNGLVVEPDTAGNMAAVSATVAESYVNSMEMSVSGDASYSIRVDAAVLQMLRAGYTLSHWETAETLASNKNYQYTFSMSDLYGNVFDVIHVDGNGGQLADDHTYQGHTCKETPFVTISIPARLNVEGSTQFEITWNNPDAATVEADVRTGVEPYPYTGEPVSLYLVEKGKDLDPANAVPLNATRPSDSAVVTGQKFLPVLGDSTSASGVTTWVVT